MPTFAYGSLMGGNHNLPGTERFCALSLLQLIWQDTVEEGDRRMKEGGGSHERGGGRMKEGGGRMWEDQTRLTKAYIMTAYPFQYSIRYRGQYQGT